MDHTDTSSSIERMLLESNPLAIVKAYKKFIPSETNIEYLECVEDFFSSLEVVTKHNLQAQIVLRESGKMIGQMKSDFYLESQDVPHVLYISDKFNEIDEIVAEIIEHLYSKISQKFPIEVTVITMTKLLS